MDAQELRECYFEWLTSKVFRFSNEVNEYSYLLTILNEIEFTYTIEKDANRYADGLELKKTFCLEVGINKKYADLLGNQCSILEMMVALAIRCEVTIMSDPSCGDRTWLWFNTMLRSMNLDSQTNFVFDKNYVEDHIRIMLNRSYDEYGNGALFTVNKPLFDMRNIEIWAQMNWYLAENY